MLILTLYIYRTIKDRNPFFRERVESEEEDRKKGEAFVFISPMNKLLAHCAELHLDATFHSVPHDFFQMLIAHAIIDGKIKIS
jgi:hypothetical protein